MTTVEHFPSAAAEAAGRAFRKLRRSPAPGDFALLDRQVVEVLEVGPVLVWVRYPDAVSSVAVQRSALEFSDTLQSG